MQTAGSRKADRSQKRRGSKDGAEQEGSEKMA